MDLDVHFTFLDHADDASEGHRVTGIADAVGAEIKIGIIPDSGESIVDGINDEVRIVFTGCPEDVEKMRAVRAFGPFVFEHGRIECRRPESQGLKGEKGRVVTKMKMDSGDFIKAQIIESDLVGHFDDPGPEIEFEDCSSPGIGNSGGRFAVIDRDDIFRQKGGVIDGDGLEAAGDHEKGEGRLHAAECITKVEDFNGSVGGHLEMAK